MPSNSPQIKVESTRALGAEIVIVGPGSVERKVRAEELAQQHGYAIVPPYDDEKIIAGQGTIGLEILADLPDVHTVFVPVGGGGLISGISAACKLSGSRARIIGVEPELASDAQASFKSGHIVSFTAEQTSRTLADGLRTQSVGQANFEHIRRFVDDIVAVSEAEILTAIRYLAMNAKLVVEPSGAVTFAAYIAGKIALNRHSVAVISGGNIEPATLCRALNAG